MKNNIIDPLKQRLFRTTVKSRAIAVSGEKKLIRLALRRVTKSNFGGRVAPRPLTRSVFLLHAGYMNASSPRVGYYACTLSSLSGAALLFLVGWGRQPSSPAIGAPPPPCACPPPPRPRLPKSQSLHVPLDVDMDHDIVPQPMEPPGYFHPQFNGALRPSKSFPEGLSHQEVYRTRPRAHRDVTVIEQITTSV